MNITSVTITIKDVKNLYDLVKASGALTEEEVSIMCHGKEHIPTEHGEQFEAGYVVFSWGKVEFTITEKDDENI